MNLFRNIFSCPENNGTVLVSILLVALATSLLIIANPGFFSHDEWDKYDHVMQHGLANYLSEYLRVRPSTEFGVPMRPVSFLVQGLVAKYMNTYPVLVHLVDVLMHAAVAILLFRVMIRMHPNRQFAWASALLLIVSPLAAFSVAWPAALMDRLYILFGLVAFISAFEYIVQKRGTIQLVVIFVASTLAILSKETGFILPLVVFIFPLFKYVFFQDKRLWVAFVVWCIPISFFLIYRLPALINSIGGAASSPYAASLNNIPDGLAVYALFPFLWTVSEAHIVFGQPTFRLWFAGIAHAALVLMLWRQFSFRVAFAYVIGFFVFLIPVLPISIKGAHYLYGSAIVTSIAVAALVANISTRKRAWLTILAPVFIVVLCIHTIYIQREMYVSGICMVAVSKSIESSYLANGRPSEMLIGVEPEALGHVMVRYAKDRQIIGKNYPLKLKVLDAINPESLTSPYIFNTSCIVYKRS